MTDEEISSALFFLGAHERAYKKGETVLRAGDITKDLGIVLSGSVTMAHDDLWGNRTILSLAEPGDLFAEVYAILGNEPLMIDVHANEDCRILFLRAGDRPKGKPDPWHITFVKNLLLLSLDKNRTLSRRAFHTASKTIRGRVMAYLDTMSLQKHSHEFDIPFDRQQMADYLNVERTALSKELRKMKDEGMIEFDRNHFKITTK